MKKLFRFLLFICILALGAFFRLNGNNWDGGQHLHPDERFLTMVANAMKWPHTIGEYLDTENSKMNPHNIGYGFYVYGTLPVILVKTVSTLLSRDTYGELTLVGRAMSGVMDILTIILVSIIAATIAKHIRPGLFQSSSAKSGPISEMYRWALPIVSAFLYMSAVAPIQISHFFAVDTYLTLFSTFCIYIIIRMISMGSSQKINHLAFLFSGIILGVMAACTVASKISGVLIVPSLAVGFLFLLSKSRLKTIIMTALVCFIVGLGMFRISLPYLFGDGSLIPTRLNAKTIANYRELKGMDSSTAMFPPAIQWRNRPAYIFPLHNMFFWGMGIPLGILIFVSVPVVVFAICRKVLQILTHRNPDEDTTAYKMLSVILLYCMTVFLYQGMLYTKNMRYFASIYPSLTVIGGFILTYLLIIIMRRFRNPIQYSALLFAIASLFLVWPMSFTAIYQRPHSRITASHFIYDMIPKGSTIGYEHWDDPLPLSFEGYPNILYTYIELPLYHPDTPEKWKLMQQKLETIEYIVLSSNRLWASIPRDQNLYPVATVYYQKLFDGSLGFRKIADITSLPCFPSASLCLYPINDTSAEESFTVYDHPQVMIFKKDVLNWFAIDRAITEKMPTL